MKKPVVLFLIILIFQNCVAQKAPDTYVLRPIHIHITDSASELNKTKLLPSMIIPAIMIGYGLTVHKNHGIFSSYDIREDIQKSLGSKRSRVDNYLQFAPYAELGALLLLKIKCKNDALNTALLIAKSELVMMSIVYPLKSLTNEMRPDGSNTHSFPSGHTAQAFLAATVIYREYQHKSAWYGAGAYAVATTVGIYRMINDKHWQNDVIVGAGIGIFSANLVYATHLHRWGRKEVCMVPTYDGKYSGMMMALRF